MRRWILLGALCAGVPGCYHTTYSTGLRGPRHAHAVTGTDHFFILGLANDATIDAAAACRGGSPSRVQVHQSFVDGLLGVITFGIYTPRSYKVWCAAERSAPPAPSTPAPAGGAL